MSAIELDLDDQKLKTLVHPVEDEELIGLERGKDLMVSETLHLEQAPPRVIQVVLLSLYDCPKTLVWYLIRQVKSWQL